ncbi:putative transcription factor interactor and regulator CCHC(Zn) family [Helianthus annuus]|nr:putative transcription factor interactor and regulator CCHC(Zn) family [Helianthus annuus]
MDQLHWFLCRLGPVFESFSTLVRSVLPLLGFEALLARAESHELFVRALHGSSTPPVAFSVQSPNQSSSRPNRSSSQHDSPTSQAQSRPNRSNSSSTNVRSPSRYSNGPQNRSRRPPTCQLCRTQGHYATQCSKLATFATSMAPNEEQLVHAFHAQYGLNPTIADWTCDTGASDHMIPNPNNVQNSSSAQGNKRVYFGNGHSLPVSHIGNTKILGSLNLNEVLVVPNLTKIFYQ